MGQQQLLLVILVTIIVGIATVVAINTFGSAADTANLDAVRQDIATIAAAAQGYYMKPNALGGGGNNFNCITFTDITNPGEIAGANTITFNENGIYELVPNGTTLTIEAIPSSDSSYPADPSTATAVTATITADVTANNMIMNDYTGSSGS